MKKSYSLLFLTFIAATFLIANAANAQVTVQPATVSAYDTQNLGPAPQETARPVEEGDPVRIASAPAVQELTMSVLDLSSRKFSSYSKNASSIVGVKVKGFCENEKVVVLLLDLPAYRNTIKGSKNPVANLDRLDLFDLLSSELTKQTGYLNTVSTKIASEVEMNCSEYNKTK